MELIQINSVTQSLNAQISVLNEQIGNLNILIQQAVNAGVPNDDCDGPAHSTGNSSLAKRTVIAEQRQYLPLRNRKRSCVLFCMN